MIGWTMDIAQPITAARVGQTPAEGVRAAAEESLLHGLFLGRSNVLFGKLEPAENYWFLSGVVIGAEVAVLASGPPRRIRRSLPG